MDDKVLQEMLELTRENNRMLHKMRRNAFWGGIIRWVIYAALLLAPLWFYMTYLNDTVQRMMKTIDQMQGTSARAQAQFGDFSAMWKEIEAKFGASTSSVRN